MEKQRYVRCRLRKKLRLLNIESEELLNAAMVALAALERQGCNANYSNTNKKDRDVNIMFKEESEAHTETELDSGPVSTERGSPSLVGRGIANPMSERTRGFEMS